jgi:hypothetical protein
VGRPGLVISLLLGACSFELSTGGPGGDDEPGGTDDFGGNGGVDDDGNGAGTVVECPPAYTAGYRLEITAGTWLAAEAACEADLPGHTHLVVLDDEPERVAVAELAQALPGDAWVGIVRDPGGSAPWPWRYVTGGNAAFAPFEGSEPNNMSGDQYTVVLRRSSRFLYDYGVGQVVQAICECDHRAPINADYDPGS